MKPEVFASIVIHIRVGGFVEFGAEHRPERGKPAMKTTSFRAERNMRSTCELAGYQPDREL